MADLQLIDDEVGKFLPNAYISKITLSNKEEELKISLNLVVKDFIDVDGDTTWFYNSDVVNNMRLMVIRSNSSNLTDKLKRNAINLEDLWEQRNSTDNFKIIGNTSTTAHATAVTGIPMVKEGKDISDYFVFNQGEKNRFVNIPYEIEDILTSTEFDEMEHVAYFCFVFFDLDSIADQYGLDFFDTSPLKVRGKVYGMEVVDNKKTVINDKIEDYRAVSEISQTYFDITEFVPHLTAEQLASTANTKIQDNVIDIPTNYLSDGFLSTQRDRTISGLFMLNFDNLMMEKGLYGNLLSNESVPLRTKKFIYRESVIEEIKVKRVRVKEREELNKIEAKKIGYEDYKPKSQSPTTIAYTGERDGKLIYDTSDTVFYNNYKNPVGFINQVPSIAVSNTAGTNDIRYYTFTDKNIASKTSGKYQYDVEISIIDGTIKFMNKILSDLEKAMSIIKDYYDIVSIPGFYNATTLQFNQSVYQYYGVNNPAATSSTFATPWRQARQIYIASLDSLLGFSDNKKVLLSNAIDAMLMPSKGTIDSINQFISLLQDLIEKVYQILGNKREPVAEENLGIPQKISSGTKAISLIKLNKVFSTVMDVDRTNYGYDYLGMPSSTDVGIPTYVLEDFADRIEKETLLYWLTGDISKASEAIVPPSEEYSDIVDLDSTKYSYLSPANIVLRNNNNGVVQISRLLEGNKNYNYERYNTLGASYAYTQRDADSIDNSLYNIEDQKNLFSKVLNTFNVSLSSDKSGTPIPADLTNTTPFSNIESDPFSDSGINAEFEASETIQYIQNLQEIEHEQSTPIRQALVSLFLQEERADREHKLSLNNYNLASDNALNLNDSAFEVPNQIKTLIMTMSDWVTKTSTGIRKNWKEEGIDILNDFKYSQVFRYNYSTIAKVEYLAEFPLTPEGKQLFHQPIFKTLTNDVIAELREKKRILCKVSQYVNHDLGIGLMSDETPIYDEYFLIAANSEATVEEPRNVFNIDKDIESPPIEELGRDFVQDNKKLKETNLDLETETKVPGLEL